MIQSGFLLTSAGFWGAVCSKIHLKHVCMLSFLFSPPVFIFFCLLLHHQTLRILSSPLEVPSFLDGVENACLARRFFHLSSSSFTLLRHSVQLWLCSLFPDRCSLGINLRSCILISAEIAPFIGGHIIFSLQTSFRGCFSCPNFMFFSVLFSTAWL